MTSTGPSFFLDSEGDVFGHFRGIALFAWRNGTIPLAKVMSDVPNPSPSSPFHSWETVRCELLHSRICDLGLKIEGSPMEPFIRAAAQEFAAKEMGSNRRSI